MASPLFSALLLATNLLGGADALELLQPRDGQAPKVIGHEFQRRHIPDRLQQIQADRQRMRRRDGMTLDVELDNEEALYLIDASVGSPGQDVKLHIDTGSSDLWVNTAGSQFCQQYSASCQAAGTYAPNDSSTYEYVDSRFAIQYVDGSGATGDYVTDRFAFAGVSLEPFQFGVGYDSSKSVGVLGIGYPAHEVAASYGQTYPNLPQKLVEDGHISTAAYSLWLNDLDASKGEILFGGVNSAKYTGELQTLPVIPEAGGIYAELIIALTAVGANGNEGSIADGLEAAALLDSGTSLMYLPDNIADAIFPAVGAQWDEQQGAAFVDCALARSTETLDLTFSTPTIRIPMNELVLTAGADVCILGVARAGSSIPVLGDTFLRSAYVVYDLANNEISLAQTNFNASGDADVKEITKSELPGATPVQNAVTDVALPSGAAARPTDSSAAASGAVVRLGAVVAGALGAGLMVMM